LTSSIALLISNAADVHTDLLVDAAREIGRPFFRLNTDHFRAGGTIDYALQNRTVGAKLGIGGKQVDLADVGLVVYRRPRPYFGGLLKRTDWVAKLLDREWSRLEEALSTMVRGVVVNPIEGSVLARNKVIQLQFACRADLRVPDTVITTNPSVLEAFLKGGDCVTKGISEAYVLENGVLRSGFTRNVELADLEGYNPAGCPTLLQRRIPPAAIWRIVMVGNSVFGCRYHGEQLAEARDSRLVQDRLVGCPTEVPSDVMRGLARMVSELGINFCSSDFIEDKAGELWFIDLNPDGQWAWLENDYGIPIARHVISLQNE
jgi:hypothetical protein